MEDYHLLISRLCPSACRGACARYAFSLPDGSQHSGNFLNMRENTLSRDLRREKMELDPRARISHRQALSGDERNAEVLAKVLVYFTLTRSEKGL
jgi:hypothetical protein